MASIEGTLFILVDCETLDIVHDNPEGIVPVSTVAFEPDMYVIDINHCVIDNPNKVLLRKGFLLIALLAPLFLHLKLYPFQHALQQFCGIDLFLNLLIADVQQNIDTLHVYKCVLFFQTGPRNINVYLLNVTEL